MNQEITDIISKSFAPNDINTAIDELSSITLNHVMAESETNLNNTWLSILQLSKSDIKELKRLVECAKHDFRDVIYWASME